MKRRLAILLGVGVLALLASPAPAQAASWHYLTNLKCSSSFTANMNVRSAPTDDTAVSYIYNVTYSSSIVADRVMVYDDNGLILAMGGSRETKNDVPKKVNNDYPALKADLASIALKVWNDGAVCQDLTGSTSIFNP